MKPKNQTKKKRTNKRKRKQIKRTTQTKQTNHVHSPVVLRIKTRKVTGGRDRQYKFDVVKYKSPIGGDNVYVHVVNDPIVVDGFLDPGNMIKAFSKYTGEIDDELVITQKGLSDLTSEGKGILVTVRDDNYRGDRRKKNTSAKRIPPLSGSSNTPMVTISVGSSDKKGAGTSTSTSTNMSTSTNIPLTSANLAAATGNTTTAKKATSVADASHMATHEKTKKNTSRVNAEQRALNEAGGIIGRLEPKRPASGRTKGAYNGLDDDISTMSDDSSYSPSSTSSSDISRPVRSIRRSQRNMPTKKSGN